MREQDDFFFNPDLEMERQDITSLYGNMKKVYRGKASSEIPEPVNLLEIKPKRARKPLPDQLPLLIDDHPLNPPAKRGKKK
jgi:hypothetical protein